MFWTQNTDHKRTSLQVMGFFYMNCFENLWFGSVVIIAIYIAWKQSEQNHWSHHDSLIGGSFLVNFLLLKSHYRPSTPSPFFCVLTNTQHVHKYMIQYLYMYIYIYINERWYWWKCHLQVNDFYYCHWWMNESWCFFKTKPRTNKFHNTILKYI